MNTLKHTLIASILLTGCVSVQSGRDFDASKAGSFQKGKSTKAEVIAAMGEPELSGGDSNGSFIEYQYQELKGGGSPLAGLGIGSTSVDDNVKQCRFNFNPSEKLKDYTCQQGAPNYSGFGK